ncbi:MAG TPA: FtsK/SpoIIIE domain-containing protein [Oligoflexia bacterium]|nr:hypothetical protein [bacterium]HMQ10880.1 FtsK/SpoIIIE domain-containing protein [Oligoflexia bacterium]HMR24099.1 FtsK/SpoIIIE domain-containing protein [Oligoflexia bacterium]
MEKHKNDFDSMGEILIFIGTIINIIFTGIWRGIKNFPANHILTYAFIALGIGLAHFLSGSKQHLLTFTAWTGFIGKFIDPWAYMIFDSHRIYYYLGLLSVYMVIMLFFIGGHFVLQQKSIQNKLDRLSLKNGSGAKAQVKSYHKLNSMQSKMHVFAPGLSLNDFESKKDQLASAMQVAVEDIQQSHKHGYVDIYLSKKPMPQKCNYSDIILPSEYTFKLGACREGSFTQDITKLPHMLIAGTTGGGKSMFFRQALLGLLESSKNIQLHLIDLKNGVEMSDFGILPNVHIAKNNQEASKLIKKIHDEMQSRFNLIAKIGKKFIVPERDELDRIVVGIDEASVLFAKPQSAPAAVKAQTDSTRHLVNEIAKLGRAAGIHLVMATQKVTKETIDTHIQDNVEGRMIFRMQTFHGSSNVLGTNAANKLPNIPGRGIWKCGPKELELQAPFISEQEFDYRLKQIKGEFELGNRKNQQENMSTRKVVHSKANGGYKKSKEGEKNDHS